jgi:hypothetical protein
VTGFGNTSSNYASISNTNVGSNSTPTKPTNTGITSQDLSIEDLNTDMNLSGLPGDLDLPDLPTNNVGITGDLADALKGL